MIFEEKKDSYLLSTDKSKLDINLIHDFLCNKSYWAKGIPLDTVKNSIDNSECFGVYFDKKQVGFARIITDKSTFGYIGDVFVTEEHRGKGLSMWVMENIMKHPELQGFRRWIILTRDAHELYDKFGFTPVKRPQNYMENHVPDIYLQNKNLDK